MGLVATALGIADIDQWQSSYLTYFYKGPLNNCILETLPFLNYSCDIIPFLEIHNAHKHGKRTLRSITAKTNNLYIGLFNPEFSDHIWPWNLHSPPSPINNTSVAPLAVTCSLFYFSVSIRMT